MEYLEEDNYEKGFCRTYALKMEWFSCIDTYIMHHSEKTFLVCNREWFLCTPTMVGSKIVYLVYIVFVDCVYVHEMCEEMLYLKIKIVKFHCIQASCTCLASCLWYEQCLLYMDGSCTWNGCWVTAPIVSTNGISSLFL